MSPKPGPARPIKKVKLKITLEDDRASLASAHKVLKGSKSSRGTLVSRLEARDPAEFIEELTRLAHSLRKAPKEFK